MPNEFDATEFSGDVSFTGAATLSPPEPTDPAHAARQSDVTASASGKQAARDELDKVGVAGADIASASTVDLEAATGEFVRITGTTGISAITLSAGHCRTVRFAASLTLTAGASLILPTGASIVTQADDTAVFVGQAAGAVRCLIYQRATGAPLAGGGGSVTSVGLAMPAGLTVSSSPVTSAGTLTVTSTLTGLIKGVGGGFAEATAGTDYLVPASIGTTIQQFDSTLEGLRGKATSGTGNIVLKSYVDDGLTTANAYADSLVVGLVDDRGNFSASSNVFPSTGGSGTAGAVKKGDLWLISAAGTLGGVAVTEGDQVRALTDTPGQTAANWAIIEANIGYVPLSQALASAKIYVGNASGIGTAVTVSGDWTISNAGVATLANSGVTANSYGSASQTITFTVDSKGRLTAASATAIAITLSQISDMTALAQTFNALSSVAAQQAALNVFPPTPHGSALTGTTNAIAYSNGVRQSATMSGNATISSITGGSNGCRLELWVSGHASTAYTLKVASGIPVGTDSAMDLVTSGKSITAAKVWILQFSHVNGGWKVTGLKGGY